MNVHRKRSIKQVVSLCLVAAALGGCSQQRDNSPMPAIDKKAEQDIEAPINCSTAKNDIATLEAEKASVGQRMLDGVRTVLPISAVAGILMGDYKNRAEVASGQYNTDINVKIEEIRTTCGIS